MKLNELSPPVMLVICDYFLDNSKEVFQQNELLKPILHYVKEARQSLLSIDSSPDEKEAELKRLANRLDGQHDLYNRSLFKLFTVLEELAKDASQQDAYQELQTALFPDALRINIMSFSEESGESSRRKQWLKNNTNAKKQLSLIKVSTPWGESSALDWLNQAITAGQELGENERQRAELKSQAQTPSAQSTSSEREARKRFLDVIRMLRATAPIALKKDSEQSNLLWGKLEEELRKPSTSVQPSTPATPTPPTPSTPT